MGIDVIACRDERHAHPLTEILDDLGVEVLGRVVRVMRRPGPRERRRTGSANAARSGDTGPAGFRERPS